MTNSEGNYRVRIPRHVVERFKGFVYSKEEDGTLAGDIVDHLRELESDPLQGVLLPDGNRLFTFKVLRAPLVYSAQYAHPCENVR